LKQYVSLSLILLFIWISCTGCTFQKRTTYKKYSYEFFGTFDTVITFIGYAENEQQFETLAKKGQARFEELHKLFDMYEDYEGINNIKTINDSAGKNPVKVSQEIIDLILFSKEWYDKTGGYVNIALGPVLAIWHDYRTEGKTDPASAKLPSMEELQKAKLKTDISKVEVDTVNSTVFLKEEGMRLDLGAVAKGYATEIVAKELSEEGFSSFVISSGGNVRAVGAPKDGVRKKWGIGIQDPDDNTIIPDKAGETLDTVFVTDASVVTSGDYQRYYEVNGQRIHHIIDPTTLMPASHYRAVTIVTENSAVGDFLSTTAFILPYDQSRTLIESIEGVEALWIMPDGTIQATDNMKSMLKNLGGASSK